MKKPLQDLNTEDTSGDSLDGVLSHLGGMKDIIEWLKSVKQFVVRKIGEVRDDVQEMIAQNNKALADKIETTKKLVYDVADVSDEMRDKLESIEESISESKESFSITDENNQVLLDEIRGIKKYMDSTFRDLSSRSSLSEKSISKVPQSIEKGVSSLRSYVAREIKRLDGKDLSKELEPVWKIIKEFEEKIKRLMREERGSGSTQIQVFQNATAKALTYGLNFIGATVTSNPITGVDITITSAGTWYQDEIVATGQTGTAFSLLHTPAAVVMLFKNGVLLVKGASYDYTISGANITLATALLSTDVLTATYN